jgi:simple sugar transport system ATP-binding protein
VGWTLDLDAPSASLPVGVQQRLEILKALMGSPKLLILDEPTAVLSPDEVLDLVRVVKSLQSEGVTLILIAHKLSEVYAMADRVTVLRKGRLAATSPLPGLEQSQLARWMVGDFPAGNEAPPSGSLGGVLLRLTRATIVGDRGEQAVRDAGLEVRAGEILGIGGVDGNGQLELAEALSQVRPLLTGELALESTPAYIPQDRQVDGLALEMPIWENLLIKGVSRSDLFRGGLLSPPQIAAWAKQLIQDYAIKAGSPNDPARSLSGGNQQKVVVSRSLSGQPQIIVAMNPTRGLDIRASAFVHEELRKAALRGAGVVLVSTDLDELAALATRTLYMSSGRLSAGGAEAYLGGTGG